MSSMRPRSSIAVVVTSTLTVAAPAAAVAPCHDVCHLSQGQPLFLVETGQIWARRCDAQRGALTCVVQRLDANGNVLAQRPAPGLQDMEFTQAELKGKTIKRLDWQMVWPDLGRPLDLASHNRKGNLTLEGSTLACRAEGAATVFRRPLGCAPTAVVVYTAELAAGPDAVVAVATCGVPGDEHESVVVCQVPGKP